MTLLFRHVFVGIHYLLSQKLPLKRGKFTSHHISSKWIKWERPDSDSNEVWYAMVPLPTQHDMRTGSCWFLKMGFCRSFQVQKKQERGHSSINSRMPLRMGSTKPYVHPHPVAKMFCFRRCTQQHQHQPAARAPCADIKKIGIGIEVLNGKICNWPSVFCLKLRFWNSLSGQKTIEKKKGLNSVQWGNHFLNPQSTPASWEVLRFFVLWKHVMKRSTVGSRWPVIWIMIQNLPSGFWDVTKISGFCSLSFHKPERKGYGVAGQ